MVVHQVWRAPEEKVRDKESVTRGRFYGGCRFSCSLSMQNIMKIREWILIKQESVYISHHSPYYRSSTRRGSFFKVAPFLTFCNEFQPLLASHTEKRETLPPSELRLELTHRPFILTLLTHLSQALHTRSRNINRMRQISNKHRAVAFDAFDLSKLARLERNACLSSLAAAAEGVARFKAHDFGLIVTSLGRLGWLACC